MTVEIPSEFQQFVSSVIDRGSYKSEADVVGTALGLLRERERRIENLRHELQPALERLDRGEGTEFDDAGLDAFFEEIKAQGLAARAIGARVAMKRYRLDIEAKEDLASIHTYIAGDNRAAADRLIDTLKQRFRLLAAQPLIGQLRPELAQDLRSFCVGNYVIFYRPGRGGIEIARVIHAARDVESQF